MKVVHTSEAIVLVPADETEARLLAEVHAVIPHPVDRIVPPARLNPDRSLSIWKF